MAEDGSSLVPQRWRRRAAGPGARFGGTAERRIGVAASPSPAAEWSGMEITRRPVTDGLPLTAVLQRERREKRRERKKWPLSDVEFFVGGGGHDNILDEETGKQVRWRRDHRGVLIVGPCASRTIRNDQVREGLNRSRHAVQLLRPP
jgi:hypothetical protein